MIISYTIPVSVLTRLFPTPPSIALSATGVDFSSTTIRFLKLERSGAYVVPEQYIEKAFPEEVIEKGVIVDPKRLTSFLKEIKKEHGFSYVRITIPESQTFLFTVSFDSKKTKNLRKAIVPLIEEYTLLKSKDATFDYSVLQKIGGAVVVQVVVAPIGVVQTFIDVFADAGMQVLSVELDAQAIARAVISQNEKGSQMIIDIGAMHTGFSIVSRGVVVYSETLPFGGKSIATRVAQNLSLSMDEVEALKRSSGLSRSLEQQEFFSAFTQEFTPIIAEINKTFMYWQQRRTLHGGFPAIEKIYICGGHSAMSGIAEYIGISVKIPVLAANPWINCLDFNEVVPKLPVHQAMSFVPAIGTALANHIPSTNLISQRRQEKIRHVRWFRLLNAGMMLLIGIIAAFCILLIPSYLIAKKQKDYFVQQITVPPVSISDLQQRVRALQAISVEQDSGIGYAEAISIVSRYVPQGVLITEYRIENNVVHIQGTVPVKQALDEYIEALQADDRISFVESPLANFLITGESQFTLQVGIK